LGISPVPSGNRNDTPAAPATIPPTAKPEPLRKSLLEISAFIFFFLKVPIALYKSNC
jgi:hypothetical protein